MGTSPSTTQPRVKKYFTSSILLWVRSDQPRHTGMDYWKGPHSRIIAATPGLAECRQVHLAEHNRGLWPATAGKETAIPGDRKIDGIAEVTFQYPNHMRKSKIHPAKMQHIPQRQLHAPYA